MTAPMLLTVEQAAERLSTKPRFVRRLIAERRIEFVFRRDGEMRTVPEVYRSRAEATQVLWKMAGDGRAD